MAFVHLHLHSEYSLLESFIRIHEIPQLLQQGNMQACALTDSQVMYGSLAFYLTMKNAGLKPLLGMQVCHSTKGRFYQESQAEQNESEFLILAYHQEGLKHLNALASLGFLEGFYRRPRIDDELLERYHEGLIFLVGGPKSDVAKAILRSDFSWAEERLLFYQKLAGRENCYIEIQRLGLPEEKILHPHLLLFSKKLGIPLVATNPSYYHSPSEAKLHEVLRCIKEGKRIQESTTYSGRAQIKELNTQEAPKDFSSTSSFTEGNISTSPITLRSESKKEDYVDNYAEEKSSFFSLTKYKPATHEKNFIASQLEQIKPLSNRAYVKTAQEMEDLFSDLPEALENTVKIAERCRVEFDFSQVHLPRFYPETGETSLAYLRRKSEETLDKLREEKKLFATYQQYQERLTYEISVIQKMGFVDYFLVVADFVAYAKKQEIPVGPGRGSGSSSLIAYCLGITTIDPLRYDLIFERFLNPDRVSLPDFDIDFCYERRQEVLDYVMQKYGSDKVCQVITFGSLAPKAALRDVARVFNYSSEKMNALSRIIDPKDGLDFEQALKRNENLQNFYQKEAEIKELFAIAECMDALPRHASTHAAGVVIAAEPLMDLAPLSLNDEVVVLQYSKSYLEKIGLLKFDFLGLRTLSVIQESVENIRKKTGLTLDLSKLDFQDPKVFEAIAKGETEGMFQLESPGMIAFLKELKPSRLEDIIAGISLFRPGPMEQIPRYVQAKHRPETIKYDHPLLEPILKETYGCIIYQEQVMRIVRDLAGFSMGQSDLVRRTMSTKNREELARYKQLFLYGGVDEKGSAVEGCIKRGVAEAIGENIFHKVLEFAGYAFNKPHAVGYSYITYQTAWLKVHYPAIFFTALLNSFLGNLSQAKKYVQACRRYGIELLRLDMNKSEVKFVEEEGKIRIGLGAVKNVGFTAMHALVEDRRRYGPFTSLENFMQRSANKGVNKKMLYSLILAGAFDFTGLSRRDLLVRMECYQLDCNMSGALAGQMSLLDQLSTGETICVFEPVTHLKEDGGKEAISLQDRASKKVLEARHQKDRLQVQPTKIEENAKETTKVQGEIALHKQESLEERNLRLKQEMEMLGLYVTGHPLDAFQSEISRLGKDSSFLAHDESPSMESMSLEDKKDLELPIDMQAKAKQDERLKLIGMVVHCKQVYTKKKQERMAILTCEDMLGEFTCVLFPEIWKKYREDLGENVILEVEGRVSWKKAGENASLIVENLRFLQDSSKAKIDLSSLEVPDPEEEREKKKQKEEREKLLEQVRLVFSYPSTRDPQDLKKLLKMLQNNPGTCPVSIWIERRQIQEDLEPTYWVSLQDRRMKDIVQFWGRDFIKLKRRNT